MDHSNNISVVILKANQMQEHTLPKLVGIDHTPLYLRAMSSPNIILPDGSLYTPDNVRPDIIGYQIVHTITGRILPGTTRSQIYSKAAAIRKMNEVASMYNVMQTSLDIWDYILHPMYDFEEPAGCMYITDRDDDLY